MALRAACCGSSHRAASSQLPPQPASPILVPPTQTVTVCLYSSQTTPRLRQAGMEFAVWVFKHSAPAQLAPAAASILDGCLQLLDDREHAWDVVVVWVGGVVVLVVVVVAAVRGRGQ